MPFIKSAIKLSDFGIVFSRFLKLFNVKCITQSNEIEIFKNIILKGQCHEIFCCWFFLWISFPPTPKCPIRTVSNFFENSRRYSQLKVDHRCRWHRWQMKNIFNQKNLNNFVGTPLDSTLNIYKKFCLQVNFKVSAAWYCSHCLPLVSLTPVGNLPPVSLIPVAICHRWRWHRRQICRRHRWHRWQICYRYQQH